MAKIELSIKTDYLPEWGTWEGVRELIQNCRDAETEFNAPMEVSHNPFTKTLTLTNKGCTLPNEALLLGYTTKTDRDDCIGKFGEGLKLGVLALVRARHKVTIYTGAEVWRPAIIESAKFNNSKVLCFSITKPPTRVNLNRVEVVIEGITREIWNDYNWKFLFLQKDREGILETHSGHVLTGENHKGLIFVKDIYVCKNKNLKYGYNFKYANIDRDRKMMAYWELQDKLTNVWVQCYCT